MSHPVPARTAFDRAAAELAVAQFLRALGFDPEQGDLRGTPARVAEAFGVELTQGYGQDPVQILRDNLIVRVDPAPAADVVMIRDVVVTTVCPHHLMPAQGKASVAFRPRGALVGIGALGQVIDACSRRLALQEDIGQAVALAVQQALSPAWVACHMVLSHSCMNARGDRRHGASVDTVATLGEVDPLLARALFLGKKSVGLEP